MTYPAVSDPNITSGLHSINFLFHSRPSCVPSSSSGLRQSRARRPQLVTVPYWVNKLLLLLLLPHGWRPRACGANLAFQLAPRTRSRHENSGKIQTLNSVDEDRLRVNYVTSGCWEKTKVGHLWSQCEKCSFETGNLQMQRAQPGLEIKNEVQSLLATKNKNLQSPIHKFWSQSDTSYVFNYFVNFELVANLATQWKLLVALATVSDCTWIYSHFTTVQPIPKGYSLNRTEGNLLLQA